MTAANKNIDLLTIMAIGIVSFIVKNVLHEALGHGGACLLVGGRALELSSAHFDCAMDAVSDAGVRFIAAAGTLVNFLFAYIFWLAFRNTPAQSSTLRYFFWFAMSGNFFVAAGYPLFSGIIGVGDWVDVVEGWQPVWMWRFILSVIGFVLYMAGVWFALHEMKTLIGSNPTERLARAFRLTLFPYLAGATASSLGALFNPIGAFVVFTSAAAAFGGSSAFAWMTQLLKTKWFPETSDQLVNINRNWMWVILSLVLALIHIFVLGPGLRFQ